MERRAEEPIAPWRVLGEANAARDEPAAPSPTGGPHVALLIVGAIATLCFAALAFLLATTAAQDAEIGMDGIAGRGPGASAVDGMLGAERTAALLVVDVGGAVARPGVYRLPAGARVGDAISAAGGFGPRVDTERASADLNLAAVLVDGGRVRVPSRDDPPAGPGPAGGGSGETAGSGGDAGAGTGGGSGGTNGSGGLVDLNRATTTELDALPGIGPVLAGRIVASRDEQPFTSVDELRGRGILGEATFAKVRDLVVVR